MNEVLRMENIVKTFGDNRANDGVSFDLRKGEIHALLGENGAGKSTLMNILYGLYRPTSGEIFLNTHRVSIDSPLKAIELGIGMVHQHFMLISAFTVLENVILGMSPKRGPFVDLQKAREKVKLVADANNLAIDLDAKVSSLSVGLQQQVEILKALYRGAEILILDEPTGVLTPQETVRFFETVRDLADNGLSVIFISHKLDEVIQISDRVSVLRDGVMIGTHITKDTDKRSLARHMVGRDVVFRVEKSEAIPGDTILSVRNISVKGTTRASSLSNVSFDLHEGEILGIAGVDGNGQRELSEVLTGLREVDEGEILFRGENIENKNPRFIESAGISFVPEDRKNVGIVRGFNVDQNFALRRQYKRPFCKRGFLQSKKISDFANRAVTSFDIRMVNRDVPAHLLSGGNMQKLILAREIMANPKLLVLMHPTRGLDVGAIEYIHARILDERSKGSAVIVISTELEEILTLSDRVAVLFRGEIQGIMSGKNINLNDIGYMMAGCH